jgi:hypothetical protein
MNGWQAMFAANSAIRFLSAKNGLPVLVIIAPTRFSSPFGKHSLSPWHRVEHFIILSSSASPNHSVRSREYSPWNPSTALSVIE